MKQLIINKENPNGIFKDVAEDTTETNLPETPNGEDAIKTFFEGLADGETNSIAKIRALAQEFLNNTK